MILPGLLRLKLLIARHGKYILALLLITGILGMAGAGWLYTHPPKQKVTVQGEKQTIITQSDTSAIVKHNTSLWQRGTRLKRVPAYPISVAPNMTIRVKTDVPNGEEVRVSQNLTLVYTASGGGMTFWESKRNVVRKNTTVTKGVAVTKGRINIKTVNSRLKELNDDLGGVGSASAHLAVTVHYETDRFSGKISQQVPIKISSTGYQLADDLQAERTHQTRQTKIVRQQPDFSTILPLAMLGLFGLVGAILVGYFRFYGPDPEAIEREIEEARFTEWISTGNVRYNVGDEYIMVDTLSDLVNVAIDSNKRVIHDEQRGIYAVIDGVIVYYFTPEGEQGIVEFEWRTSSDVARPRDPLGAGGVAAEAESESKDDEEESEDDEAADTNADAEKGDDLDRKPEAETDGGTATMGTKEESNGATTTEHSRSSESPVSDGHDDPTAVNDGSNAAEHDESNRTPSRNGTDKSDPGGAVIDEHTNGTDTQPTDESWDSGLTFDVASDRENGIPPDSFDFDVDRPLSPHDTGSTDGSVNGSTPRNEPPAVSEDGNRDTNDTHGNRPNDSVVDVPFFEFPLENGTDGPFEFNSDHSSPVGEADD